MKITDTAKEQLGKVFQEHPDKLLRVVFEGFG